MDVERKHVYDLPLFEARDVEATDNTTVKLLKRQIPHSSPQLEVKVYQGDEVTVRKTLVITNEAQKLCSFRYEENIEDLPRELVWAIHKTGYRIDNETTLPKAWVYLRELSRLDTWLDTAVTETYADTPIVESDVERAQSAAAIVLQALFLEYKLGETAFNTQLNEFADEYFEEHDQGKTLRGSSVMESSINHLYAKTADYLNSLINEEADQEEIDVTEPLIDGDADIFVGSFRETVNGEDVCRVAVFAPAGVERYEFVVHGETCLYRPTADQPYPPLVALEHLEQEFDLETDNIVMPPAEGDDVAHLERAIDVVTHLLDWYNNENTLMYIITKSLLNKLQDSKFSVQYFNLFADEATFLTAHKQVCQQYGVTGFGELQNDQYPKALIRMGLQAGVSEDELKQLMMETAQDGEGDAEVHAGGYTFSA